MENPDSLRSKPAAGRIESVDLLRGITILVMLFVNDVAGVHGTPAWMKHIQPSSADGMTFVDIVFPAFLFIVGMAIPLAMGSRLARGESLRSIWRHVLIRTLSLLVIGVFMVNTESMGEGGLLPKPVWTLLMYIAVILVWNSPSGDRSPSARALGIMRWIGAVLLIGLAVLYRGSGEPGLIEMRPQWWGILGLIGWSYLVGCAVYTLLHKEPAGLLGVSVLLYAVYLGDAGGLFGSMTAITRWVDFGSMLGSHGAVTVAGVLLGTILRPNGRLASHAGRIRWALLYAAGLWSAAILVHSLADVNPAFYYNKNAATPAWGLMSSAVTVAIWVAVYYLVDVRGVKFWTPAVEPAGRNALFAYVLAPVVYSVLGILALAGFDLWAVLGSSFAVGFWRALLFAFAMTWLAGALQRYGVRLKL